MSGSSTPDSASAAVQQQRARESKAQWQGAGITQVKDLGFAVALFSAGVPLHSTKPGDVLEYAGGVQHPVFNFMPTDQEKTIEVQKIAWAANDPMRFIAENPGHPLAYTLASIINYPLMARAVHGATPVVPMVLPGGGPALLVTKGSRRYQAALRRGYIPAPPPSLPASKLKIEP